MDNLNHFSRCEITLVRCKYLLGKRQSNAFLHTLQMQPNWPNRNACSCISSAGMALCRHSCHAWSSFRVSARLSRYFQRFCAAQELIYRLASNELNRNSVCNTWFMFAMRIESAHFSYSSAFTISIIHFRPQVISIFFRTHSNLYVTAKKKQNMGTVSNRIPLVCNIPIFMMRWI